MARKKIKLNFLNTFFQSIFNNAWAYDVYYDKLKEITVTLYKWVNLPPEIDERFLELSLFETGEVLFFKDEYLDQYAIMRTANMGRWDLYNRPLKRRGYASNGIQVERTNEDSVLIYNNVLRTSSDSETLYYAEKFAFYDQIINININAQKTPLFIRCSENERLTLKNLFLKYDGGQPVIFGDKNISPMPIEVLKTDAPFIAPQIYDMKVKYWNEFLTFKGVSNVNINKKERLTTDEVQRQLGGSIAARGSGLLMRKEAADAINKMFGLEIDVIFNEDYQLRVLDENDELIDENDGQEGGTEE